MAFWSRRAEEDRPPKKKGSGVALMIVGALLLGFSASQFLEARIYEGAPVAAETLMPDEIRENMALRIQEAVWLDGYAYTTTQWWETTGSYTKPLGERYVTSQEVAVALRLADGDWAVVSLLVPMGDKMEKVLKEYRERSDRWFGDYTFTTYATTSKLRGEFEGYLKQYVDDVLGEWDGIRILPIQLMPRGENLKEYRAQTEPIRKNTLWLAYGSGGVGLAILAVGVARFLRHRRERKEEEERVRQKIEEALARKGKAY